MSNFNLAFGKDRQNAAGCFRVLQSDDQAVILEVNAGELQVTSLQNGSEGKQKLSIAGMSQTIEPNQPQLPTCGGLVGLSAPEGISLMVLEAEYETLQGVVLDTTPEENADLLNVDIVSEPTFPGSKTSDVNV